MQQVYVMQATSASLDHFGKPYSQYKMCKFWQSFCLGKNRPCYLTLPLPFHWKIVDEEKDHHLNIVAQCPTNHKLGAPLGPQTGSTNCLSCKIHTDKSTIPVSGSRFFKVMYKLVTCRAHGVRIRGSLTCLSRFFTAVLTLHNLVTDLSRSTQSTLSHILTFVFMKQFFTMRVSAVHVICNYQHS